MNLKIISFVLGLLFVPKFITAQTFKTSEPETVISQERLLELGIREMDAGIFMLTERENCKWFTTCSKTPEGQMTLVGPRENPYEFLCEKGMKIQGLPNRRADRDWGGNFDWIANIYDMKNGNVLAFIHTEESIKDAGTTGKGGVYTRFGLALSRDGGRNFNWLGYILEPNITFREWFLGSGNLNLGYANYIIKDGYFYVYYRDTRLENNSFVDGVAVMRAPIDEVVQAALSNRVTIWHKYYDKKWIEPGLGGRFTPLNIPVKGLMHGDASYNEYLKKYVLVVRGSKWENVKESELNISFSDDGIIWSDWKVFFQDSHLNDYPSIISLGDNNEITGKEFYVYFLKHYDKLMPEKFGKIRCDRIKLSFD